MNEDGVRFYNGVLDELEKYGIKPIVTLFHCDHPQKVEDLGGWLNDDIVEIFATYARRVFQVFAPRVSIFTTVNEPSMYCTNNYRKIREATGKF